MIARKTGTGAHRQERLALGTLDRIWLIALVIGALLLTLINLPYSPRTWFDEGSHLHVPKTLVQYGVYADISSEGFRYYGPTVGIGPTIMLPIALVFQFFGSGLLQGRLVIVIYFFIAFATFYVFARRMHGRRVALLGLTLFLASRTLHRDGIIEYGRQVLGEAPGVAFLLLGGIAWLAALSTQSNQQIESNRATFWGRHTLYCLLSGVGFGLALVTKNQFALIIPAALIVTSLLDWLYYRAGTWCLRLLPFIVASGCFGLWTLAQFQFLGPGSFVENMQQMRQAAGGAIFVFDFNATLRAGKYLLFPDLYGSLLIPALCYAGWRARRRDAQGLAEGLVVVIIGLWLTWFVGASLAWPRYAFPAVAFSALTVARAVADLFVWLRSGEQRQRRLSYVVASYTALIIAFPLALSTRAVLQPDYSAHRMADYLNTNVPLNTIVETWEPELGAMTDHRYHYPPIALLDTAVRHQWLGGPPIIYNGLQDAPEYVVVGPFGAYTNIYAADILAQDYIEQQRFGPYSLFKRQ
jgi:4-amino-4-deoxy-L-arabinose transferase-like glycosyltransferase